MSRPRSCLWKSLNGGRGTCFCCSGCPVEAPVTQKVLHEVGVATLYKAGISSRPLLSLVAYSQ